MGCILSHVQVLFNRSEDKESPMFSRNSRSRSVLMKCQASTILTPATKQRGGIASSVPYSNLDETSGEGLSLEDAVTRRDKDLLERLIHAGAAEADPFNIHNKRAKKKTNPVELACNLGFTDIIEVFLDNGCSPNLPTSQGRLIHSVLEGMKCSSITLTSGRQLIQLLCDSGCDVNIRDVRYNTTLLYASELGDYVVLETILKHCTESQLSHRCGGSSYTPLHMSAMRGDTDCVKLLLQYSPSKHVNLQDRYGNTALLLALKAMSNNLKYLNSAKDDMSNQSSKSSVHWEKEKEKLLKFQHCSVSVVEHLLLAGADVNIIQSAGHIRTCSLLSSSPLCYALDLCILDETNGFQEDSDNHRFTETMHLVSTEKIQNLEKWSTDNSDNVDKPMSVKENFSVYAGVVRLIVLSGAQLDVKEEEIFQKFPSVVPLLEEISEFWTRYQLSKPPKLMHVAKQALRNHLASLQALHKLNELPLPERLKEYVKLNCL